MTGLPPSHGQTVILTIVDRFSKMVHYVPLAKLLSTTETADLLALHVFRLHGLPTDIVSDRGPQFTSWVWQAFCKIFNITCSLTSGYHPQSNGKTERANQDLETGLHCVMAKNSSSWSSFLTWVEYSHNSLSSAATGMTLTATSRLLSLLRNVMSRSPLFRLRSPTVWKCGRRPERPLRTLHSAVRARQIVTASPRLPTYLDRECGFLPATFPSKWSHVSWPHAVLAPF